MIEKTKSTPFLTTVENVWNPFTNFDEWLSFDRIKQHYSNETLGKIALVSDQLSDEENRQEIERAIDRIVEIEPTKEFVKVYKETFDKDIMDARRRYVAWYDTLDDDSKEDSYEVYKVCKQLLEQ